MKKIVPQAAPPAPPTVSRHRRRDRIALAILLCALCLLTLDDVVQRALVHRAEYVSQYVMRHEYAAQDREVAAEARAVALQAQIDQMKAERARDAEAEAALRDQTGHAFTQIRLEPYETSGR